MPAFVVPYKCDGCGQCVTACPQSILHIDRNTRKAFNIETDMCWECLPCIKVCPQTAIEVRGYSDFSPLGGKVNCKRDTDENIITWFISYKDGTQLKFVYPIRTTRWGSIKPPSEYAEAPLELMKAPLLFGEPDILGVRALPVPRKLGQ